jgi:arylsulfatase A-like enzyme
MKKQVIYALTGLMGLAATAQQKHVVFVTIDDLSRSSIGVHGCSVTNITPNMDALAQSGLRFEHCHVANANCTPSRNVMISGMFGHNNRVLTVSNEGSGNITRRFMMPHVFSAAGYHTGIMGKNGHAAPFEPYSGWDVEYDGYGSTREPENVYSKLTAAFSDAATAGKPLYFNLNIYDPHVAWYGWDHKEDSNNERVGPIVEDGSHGELLDPGEVYTANDVPYPSFFPALSAAEQQITYPISGRTLNLMDEVAAYYNSVKRADKSIGRMLDAIADAGEENNTIILLVSDHGVELPGGKTMLYHESSVSPLFVKWPGVTSSNTVDNTHVVNSVDLLPTFCEIVGQPIPAGRDGRSIVPIIQGQTVSDWPEYVYKQHGNGHNMRAVQTTDLLYIFNPWSDGNRTPSTVSKNHVSWDLIELAGQNGNAEAAAWAEHFQHRTVEELYDITVDPDCKTNLISDSNYATQLADMRSKMEAQMTASGDDDILVAFQNKTSQPALDQYMTEEGARISAMKNDAQHSRAVFFDPLDDWVVLGHTIFEAGDWGIWEAGTAGVTLSTSGGHTKYGNGSVEFDGSVADTARLSTVDTENLSAFSQLKFHLYSLGTSLSSGATMTFQYNDGSGWSNFEIQETGSQTLNANNIDGKHNSVTLELPAGGMPSGAVQLGIKVEFAGGGGQLSLDNLRATGWEDWTVAQSDDFEIGLGGWTSGGADVAHDTGSQISGSGSAQLRNNNGAASTLSLANAIDASGLGHISVELKFRGVNLTSTDQLVLEYYDGTQWVNLRTYAYDYSHVKDALYTDTIDMTSDAYAFSSSLSFRLRSETGGASQELYVDDISILTRTAPSVFGTTAPPPSGGPIFSEDFESQSYSSEWTVVDPAGNGADLVSGAASGGSGYGCRLRKNASITASFSTLGYEAITVAFDHQALTLNAPEDCVAEWSADGSTWNEIVTLNAPDGTTSWTTADSYSLGAGADDQSTLQLRFTVTANKNAEKTNLDNIVVTGTAIGGSQNNAPAFSSDPINKSNATENQAYSGSIAADATDADSDPLTFSSISGPAWLSVASDGSLSGTPGVADVGPNSWTVEVDDGNGGTDSASLEITVDAASSGPQVIFSDDFESGTLTTNGWDSLNADQYMNTAEYAGTYGANIRKGGYISKTISTVGYTSVDVSYWRKCNTLSGSEELTVEWSVDGTNWNLIETSQDSTWTPYSDTLPAGAAGEAGFTLRFNVDSNLWKEKAYIDDVVIIAQ